MTYVKIDDGIFSHPKVLGVHPLARLLWVASICHAGQHVTDGRDEIDTSTLVRLLAESGAGRHHVGQLVDAELWGQAGPRWKVADWGWSAPTRPARRMNHIPAAVRAAVFLRDKAACVACGAADELHIDHIEPRSKGGTDEPSNLQVLCSRCNLIKGDRTMDHLLARLAQLGVL